MTQKGLSTPLVVILPDTVINPNRMQTYGPGGGGGYDGDGIGWRLQEGPPREQEALEPEQQIALSDFTSALINSRNKIYNDYSLRSLTYGSTAVVEVDQRTRAAREGLVLLSPEYWAAEQKVALEVIREKQALLHELSPKLYGMFGQSPYFLVETMAQVSMRDLLKNNAATPGALAELKASHDEIYEAALEYEGLSWVIALLADSFASKAQVYDPITSQSPPTQAQQESKLGQIADERDVHFQALPEFLQVEVVEKAGDVSSLSVAQALEKYKNAMQTLAAEMLAAVGPVVGPPSYTLDGGIYSFPVTDPAVPAKLSTPQLQALFELVFLQTNTLIGHKWQSHHDAVLKQESARQLTKAATSLEKLANRASETEKTLEALKFSADFMKDVTEKFGAKASAAAKDLAEQAKGPRIRNAQQALEAYEQYRDVLNKKFSAKDRQAISNALQALDLEMMGKNLERFSRVFASANDAKDVYDLLIEFDKGVRTDDWTPFFFKAESVFGGKLVLTVAARAATWMFGLASATALSNPVGILIFA